MLSEIQKWIRLSLIFLIILNVSSCSNSSDTDDKNWKLVWQDEFDGAADQLPDLEKWNFDIGTDWGNRQLEYDTDRPANVSLDGEGNLRIIARKEQYEGQNYTSARITTKSLYEFTYGRVEARIKLPWGQGIWPAFWMLGNNIDEVSWPQCGEIDIMEYRGQEPSRVHGTLHGPGYSANDAITEHYDLYNDRFDTGFHIFAAEWSADEIKFFVDDVLYHTVTPEDVTGEWVYDHPFYIIFNVAVGGGYVGSPNENTIFPQTMLIDYVRVYQ